MKVKATTGIQHDGKDYAAGDTLEVTEAQAKTLIVTGAAEKIQSEQKADKPKSDAKKS